MTVDVSLVFKASPNLSFCACDLGSVWLELGSFDTFAFSGFLLRPVAKKVEAGGGLRVVIALLCIACLTLVPRQRSATRALAREKNSRAHETDGCPWRRRWARPSGERGQAYEPAVLATARQTADVVALEFPTPTRAAASALCG